MQSDSPHDYFLGHSGVELRRLGLQNAFYRAATENLLRRAGLVPGMRVLDIGCGGGDVSLLAGEIVGPAGVVLGLDRTETAIAGARARAAAAGVTHVQFAAAELSAFHADAPFDALIGRFVLMYFAEPAAMLRALMRNLKAGGLVAFQEMDMPTARSHPHAPLFQQCADWYVASLALGGFEVSMGSRLFATFIDAGLAQPQVIVESRIDGGPHSPVYELMAENVRMALPMLERHKVASAADVGIDTLAARLRAEALEGSRCFMFPLLIGAWAQKTERE